MTTFDATVNGVNELDLKLQEIRTAELQCIRDEASKLREQATDVNEAMEEVNNYLNRLNDLCTEVNPMDSRIFSTFEHFVGVLSCRQIF